MQTLKARQSKSQLENLCIQTRGKSLQQGLSSLGVRDFWFLRGISKYFLEVIYPSHSNNSQWASQRGILSRNHADFLRFHAFTHWEENRDFTQKRTKICHFTHPRSLFFIFTNSHRNFELFTHSCSKKLFFVRLFPDIFVGQNEHRMLLFLQ